MMQTANGPVSAEIGTIEELRFGSVVARGLDAAIAPNIGRTNVLGMNLLSRLRSWRVGECDDPPAAQSADSAGQPPIDGGSAPPLSQT